ncbi:MAG: hypothetical protein ABTQ73_02545 [Caldilineales bacterium]
MNELLRLPFGPVLVLLSAGILLRIFSDLRRNLPLALLTLPPLALIFLLLSGWDNLEPAQSALTWWPLVVAPLRVLWAVDGWNWLGLMLLLLGGGSAVLITWRAPGKRSGAYHGLSFVLLAAAALTVISDSLLALGAAWVATDILLLARARGSSAQPAAAPVWLEVAGSLLLLVGISITSIPIASTTLTAARLPDETLVLLLLAAALRMAAFPLHLWLVPANSGRERGGALLLNSVSLITGGWLLGRLLDMGAAQWLSSPLWLSLALLMTLLATLTAWISRDDERMAFFSSSRATWLWAVAALAPVSLARDALGWGMVSVMFVLILATVGQMINEQWHWRVPTVAAVVTLAGVPLSSGLGAQALRDTTLLPALLIIITDALAIAVLLRYGKTGLLLQSTGGEVVAERRGLPVGWRAVRLLTVAGLGLVPNLLWGLQPQRLAALAGFVMPLSLGQMLAELGVVPLLAMLISVALGVVFYTWAEQPDFSLRRRRQARLMAVADFSWLLNGLSWGVKWAVAAWNNMILIIEGEGYLGWVIVCVLLAVLAARL